MEPKSAKISLAGVDPMKIEFADGQAAAVPDDIKVILNQIGTTFNAYLKAAQELLNGRFSHLREVAPVHLADPGKILVTYCGDGIVVRYERNAGEKVLIMACAPNTLANVQNEISHTFVHCNPKPEF